MKCLSLVAITAILLLGSENTIAQTEDDINVLLGAAAGAAIGSTIGDGDGRKIATALGGIIGANMARDRYGYGSRRFDSYCRDRVPREYRRNAGVSRAWVEGCVERLEQRQSELEQFAYEQALNQ